MFDAKNIEILLFSFIELKNDMKILFCGDINARSGREVVQKYIPYLKKTWKLDCVIANGENAQHGCGITEKTCAALYECGVDVITTGNHVWDQKEIFSYIEKDPRLLRPINFIDTVPGKGFYVHKTIKGDILVINAMGQIFVRPTLDNPFPIIENLLKLYKLGQRNLKAIIVDFHAEATSEKIALGYFLDGVVSMVVGTHTHVPTSDTRILPKSTAFMSDCGMCGDYNSIIGAPIDSLTARYLKKIPMMKKPDPAQNQGTLCGVYLETNDETGMARLIRAVRIGPHLPETWPEHLEMTLR